MHSERDQQKGQYPSQLLPFSTYLAALVSQPEPRVSWTIVKAAKIDIRTKNKVSARTFLEQFYRKVGSNPRTTAQAGLRALERDIAVMPTPLYGWSPYLLHRLFPFLLERIIREVWKQIGLY